MIGNAKLVIVAALSLVIAAGTFARIINVPGDYAAIQAAINAGNDGDTVLVNPGIYYENVDFYGHNVVLASLFLTTGDISYIEQTIIDGDSSGSVVTFQSGENNTAVITGLTLQNGVRDFGGGIRCTGISSPTIEYNIITNNAGLWAAGGVYFESTFSLFSHNVVYHNYTIGFGGGIVCILDSNPTIINNTISDNVALWGGGISYMESSIPVIINTICWGDSAVSNSPEVFGDETSMPTFSYCDVENNVLPGEGNIAVDPMFVDPYSGDFHLLGASPCIDAGDPDSPCDPDSTRADMGALYYDRTTGIRDNPVLPRKIVLNQNFPNPFNASTTIRYELPERAHVRIDICDLIGRKVTTLTDGLQPAGFHQVLWRAEDLSSGIYFYKIQAGDFVAAKKLLLVK